MDSTLQTILCAGAPAVAVLAGGVVNAFQVRRFREHMDAQFFRVNRRSGSMVERVLERVERFEGVMDARLTRIEQELKLR
jgi:hypothetical protein